ncbi:MAG: DUF4444 domain-containing protein [Roseovarius sp.]|nr:DUF4444 domain-containing protein [Roseovarius sp.]
MLSGERVEAGIDPFERACALAALGCDAGLIVHGLTPERLTAALVLAPEVPLEPAMAMLPACGIGFQNALGALGPAELAVHLDWDGGIRVNGAACGRLRAMAGGTDPRAEPGWLVIGLEMPLVMTAPEPGLQPDRTALYEEGCAELDPIALLEAWARHTLVWIRRWEDGELRALQAEWRGLVNTIGEDVVQNGQSGTFLGVDEHFGMLLRDGETTHLIPLSSVLETAT